MSTDEPQKPQEEAEKPHKASHKHEEEQSEESGGDGKIGRKTLALLLGHIEKREGKKDEIIQKQSREGWWLAVLLVLGLLASIGVASAVKIFGTSLQFSAPATGSTPAETPKAP